jgi:hypothetical protein
MKSVKTRHKVTAQRTAYLDDQGQDYPDVRLEPERDILWALCDEDETRALKGKTVKVVRFWINAGDTYYFMPRDEFERSTERFPGQQSGQ